MSVASTSVVSTLRSRTTNITGFRTMCRGESLTNDSWIARTTIGRSKSGRFFGVISEHPPCHHRQVLDDGAERERRKEGEGADNEDHTNEQRDEQRAGDRKSAGARGRDLLARQKSAERDHRYEEREAAEEHRRAEHRVVEVRGAREPRERAAVVAGGRRVRVQNL